MCQQTRLVAWHKTKVWTLNGLLPLLQGPTADAVAITTDASYPLPPVLHSPPIFRVLSYKRSNVSTGNCNRPLHPETRPPPTPAPQSKLCPSSAGCTKQRRRHAWWYGYPTFGFAVLPVVDPLLGILGPFCRLHSRNTPASLTIVIIATMT